MYLDEFELLMQNVDDEVTFADLSAPRPKWMRHGACRDHPEVNFFPSRGDDVRPAKAVCASCAVQAECLDYAMSTPLTTGVWGGTSDRERKRMRNPKAA